MVVDGCLLASADDSTSTNRRRPPAAAPSRQGDEARSNMHSGKSCIRLRVLTLNCWGIRYLSKQCSERYDLLQKRLLAEKYDIVMLQEVWSEKDYLQIKDSTRETYPHSHYFRSGVIGSGLCILSKHPLVDTLLFKYSVNGYPYMVNHGDWFGGKAVGLAVIDIGGITVNTYITHLHAEYNREKDAYHPHRVLQAWELAQVIRHTSHVANVVLLGGDLNMHPGDLGNRLLRSVAGLTDSYEKAQNYEGPQDGCTLLPQNCFTCKNELATFPNGIRIDYILYKGVAGFSMSCEAVHTTTGKSIDGQGLPLSDHESVTATLLIQIPDPKLANPSPPAESSEEQEVLEEARAEVARGLRHAERRRTLSAQLGSLSGGLLLLQVVALVASTLRWMLISVSQPDDPGLSSTLFCSSELGMSALATAVVALVMYILFSAESKALRGAEEEIKTKISRRGADP
uniref:sphingomyelin phosphodiesterase n=3 Tax=Petromyzon marinus TaxID=7757 RepID=A0AAJ7SSL0_PETMA|nr:sphingomyelin phosphodiesterase 2 isoform X1 [Petromyzon marinus]XP_032804821.1 sphingomyelin phosphodiesterase 2 isoform X1 [Petromyzon marinus]XP_032804822.1 sphingomyelin phosphodiesterase 2 isoform X2 [Petromyzon marinus]